MEIDKDVIFFQLEAIRKHWRAYADQKGYFGRDFLFFYFEYLRSDEDRDECVEFINGLSESYKLLKLEPK